ncbi:GGDEF domain-containing protein [Photobacterium frigidiphilum]|uniref:GGDEF domain-containing protein n=1 Tax=Photobacterium frigidiphilum TaxID=264736 RepID=UPI003D0EBF45
MNNVSQLPMRLIIIVCIGFLLSALIPSSESLEVLTSIITLVLIMMLLREDFGMETKSWLILALGTYSLGVFADLLDEIPELGNHKLLNNADDVFMHIGVFLMCFCFIKILHQRRTLIDSLNTQVTKARDLESVLSRQALQDELTGLLNRRSLFRRFDEMAINHQRGMLAYIDIDNFKQVNDRLGHSRGDELLVITANSLLKTAPLGSRSYRIGGDEFIVLLPSDDQQMCDEWISELYDITKNIREEYNIGISVGIAPYYPGNLSDPDSILMQADKAMYTEKNNKNREKA